MGLGAGGGKSLEEQLYGDRKFVKARIDSSDDEEDIRLKKLGAVKVEKGKKKGKAKIILAGGFK